MAEFVERKEEIEVPRGSGVDGFILTIRKILELPRVLSVHIEGSKVRYSRSARKDEPLRPVAMEFETLRPSHVIRNSKLEELPDESNAAFAICRLFQAASIEHFYPVAFASGAKTHLWEWHTKTTSVDLRFGRRDHLYGVPFILDEALPNESIFLCTAYSSGSSLVDTKNCFKMTMPLGLEEKR